MLWAASLLQYFGFLHASEFPVLNMAGFSPSLHQGILANSLLATSWMQTKCSQTNPSRKCCFLHMGIGQHPLCAVHSVMTYLASRGNVPGILLLIQNGQPLPSTCLINWLWQIMIWANITGNLSNHSLCIGAAAVVTCGGVPDHLKQTIGHWYNNAYQPYIRTLSASLEALSTKLALSICPGKLLYLLATFCFHRITSQ